MTLLETLALTRFIRVHLIDWTIEMASSASRRTSSSVHFDVLIVGAGHAGAQAAIALRQAKFAGSIGLLGDEPELPYERPPLSKDYLAGEKSFDRLLLRPSSFWVERSITILSGHCATSLDAEEHQLECENGAVFTYGELIWATGGTPRRLPCSGHDLAGVHTVRTRADVDRLRAELPAAAQIAIIGGGYIGLEAAAVLASAGKSVTVLEAEGRALARVAGETLSKFYEAEHRAHGVEMRFNVKVECLEESDGKVTAVRLSGGERLTCDLVIVGIGIAPSIEPLRAAGASSSNGVEVDDSCRTSLPHVFAIGDCALHSNQYASGGQIRLESVQNAKLQTVGLSIGHDEVVVRGDPTARSFTAIYLRAGIVIALDCVNATKDYVQGRRLVVDRARIAANRLADTSLMLSEM